MKEARRSVSKKRVILFSLLFSFLPVMNGGPACAEDYAVDGNHTSCVSCHRMPRADISEARPFPEGVEPSSLCLDCHHYTQNHHPVNFRPGREFDLPGRLSFPLFDGEMRCLTCHKVHGEGGPARNPRLLRGGPYTQRTEVCFLCHDKDLNRKINPHRMVNDQGIINEVDGAPICLLCHAAVPDQTQNPVAVTFRADVAFLCWRCHPPMANDGFFRGHFLVKPKQRTLAYMLKEQERDGVVFPLLNRDRITCSTCHNPHQKGVIADGPASAGEDAPDRLRMPEGRICFGCHNM